MASINVYNMAGEKAGTMKLNDAIFGCEYKEALIHQVVVAQLANLRQGTKSTLTRSEVRGGGIKPWRQKGTGRARQGSIRSPQWVKGGVVFAPKPRDFSKKINKVAKLVALKSALSRKVEDKELIVIDTLSFEEAKTKNMISVLQNLKIEKSVLIVTMEKDDIVMRVSGNIPKVDVSFVQNLNVYDIVRNSKILITKEAVKKIEEVYA